MKKKNSVIIFVCLFCALGIVSYRSFCFAKDAEVNLEFDPGDSSSDSAVDDPNDTTSSDAETTVVNAEDDSDSAGVQGNSHDQSNTVNANSSAQENDNSMVGSSDKEYTLLDDFSTNLLVLSKYEGIYGGDLERIGGIVFDVQQKIDSQYKTISTRASLLTFFMGSDYKNMVVVRNYIDEMKKQNSQLREIAQKITDKKIASDVSAQADKINSYVDSVEKKNNAEAEKFSVFGWLMKKIYHW